MQVSVLEYLETTAERLPDKPALIDSAGALTYRELVTRARSLAASIASRDRSRNEAIAVFLPKSKKCVVAFAGILYSGNCYAPVDVKTPKDRLSTLLNNLKPILVISDSVHERILMSAGFPKERIHAVDCIENNVPGLLPSIDTDPAYIIHTSGSTGIPKGVVISHRSIIDYIEWARDCYSVSSKDVIGNQAPFHFDNSTLDIYLCFSAGATLVIIPESYFSFPARLISYLRDQAITMIFWVPSVIAAVANLDVLTGTDLPLLKKILFAGEVMQNRHLNYWRRKFPDALFSNLYGPTEITVDCTYYIVDREFADDEPLPIGFPCRNSDVLILTESGRPAAENERGELCVRGSSLAHGYWNDLARTELVFTQNPLNRHYRERIYRTGDIVYRNGRGEIYFVGRNDHQIKHLGHRIELGEIETALLGITEVRNACAIYRTETTSIVMFYESDFEIPRELLRAKVLEKLPKYMLPAVFHRMAELPRNPNGKIDRSGLAEMLAAEPAVV